MLEIRPVAEIDKGTAAERLLGERSVELALFGGDDRGDLDAFAALREMANAGRLRAAVCVGVASDEAPAGARRAGRRRGSAGPTGFSRC